jgi:hypothetical protein
LLPALWNPTSLACTPPSWTPRFLSYTSDLASVTRVVSSSFFPPHHQQQMLSALLVHMPPLAANFPRH